jgi:hypothetical protein
MDPPRPSRFPKADEVADSPGPPPLEPFDLVLHHDGRWTHEGMPFRNKKLREAFDRGVVFLPEEGDTGKYVVRLRHFRGEIIVEEAGFFVRDYDPPTGNLTLSDRSVEPLDVSSLRPSPIDGALLCTIKRELSPAGIAARFCHNAQSELLNAVEQSIDGPALSFGGGEHPLPDW